MTVSSNVFPISEALKKRRLSNSVSFIRIALICVAVCLFLGSRDGFAFDVQIVEDTTTTIEADSHADGQYRIRVVNEFAEAPRVKSVTVVLKDGTREVQRQTVTLDDLGQAQVKFDSEQGNYEIEAEYSGDAYSQSSRATISSNVKGMAQSSTEKLEQTSNNFHTTIIIIVILAAILSFVAYRYRSQILRYLDRFRSGQPKLPPLRSLEKQLKAAKPAAHTTADTTDTQVDNMTPELMRKHIVACFEAILSRKNEVWGLQSPSAFAEKYASKLKEKDAAYLRVFCERIEAAAFDPAHAFSIEETRELHKQAKKILRIL